MIKEKSDWLFRSEVSELNPDVEILEDYINSTTKMRIRCKLCGEEYYDLPSNILSGKLHKKSKGKLNGCRWCKHWYHDKKEQRNIVHKLNCIYRDIQDIDFIEAYNPITAQIKCRCKICGNIFLESLDNLYALNYQCEKCNKQDNMYKESILQQSARTRKLNFLFKNSEHIELLSKDKSNLQCKCDICGKTFIITGYMKRKKITCPYCYKEKRNAIKKGKRFEKNNAGYTSIKRKCDYTYYCLTTKNFLCEDCKIISEPYYKKGEFKSIVEASNKHIELCGDYIDSTTKIDYRCKKCGSVYSAKPYNLINGNCGCKKCNQSKGELIISSYLDEHNISYEREKIFSDCKNKKVLRFDFYIDKLKVAIEYDGRQHFEPVSFNGINCDFNEICKRDKIKDDYCKKKKINLIRIPYYCKDIYSELDCKLNLK